MVTLLKNNDSVSFLEYVDTGGYLLDSTDEQILTLLNAWDTVATANPGEDWIIEVQGPMVGVCYRFEGSKNWVAFLQNGGME